MHTPNATNTFVLVAPDTSATTGTEPPARARPTVAWRTHQMLAAAPYAYTSDDVLFTVWADAKDVPPEARDEARAAYFSKGQPCFRASPLTRTYGWGVHHDAEGRVAIVAMETAAYARMAGGVGPDGEPLKVVAAMRSRR